MTTNTKYHTDAMANLTGNAFKMWLFLVMFIADEEDIIWTKDCITKTTGLNIPEMRIAIQELLNKGYFSDSNATDFSPTPLPIGIRSNHVISKQEVKTND